MILAACGGKSDLVDLSDAAREEEAARAAKFDAAGLVHMIALCENVQRATKSSSVPRALFDALIVRLALTDKLADVTALVSGSTVASAGRSNGAAPAAPSPPAPVTAGSPPAKKRGRRRGGRFPPHRRRMRSRESSPARPRRGLRRSPRPRETRPRALPPYGKRSSACQARPDASRPS